MDQSQPKKRGRKKKILQESTTQAIKANERVEEPMQETLTEQKINSPFSKDEITFKLEEARNKLDNLLEPENLVNSIHNKILKRSLGKREEEMEMAIYKRIKQGEATGQEISQWTDQITGAMAKRICRILDFLLQSGPITKIEESVLESCAEALRSYYAERLNLISEEGYFYLKSTYFPERGTCSFKYLVEVIEIRDFNELLLKF